MTTQAFSIPDGNTDLPTNGAYSGEPEFAERLRRNQARLGAALKPQYDFVSPDRVHPDRLWHAGWLRTLK